MLFTHRSHFTFRHANHSPTIILQKGKKRKWLIHRCRRCLIATLSRKRKRDQIIIRREPKKHTAARGIYIGTNGLEKMLDDIRLSVFNKIFRCLIFVITEKRVNPSNFSSSINIRTTRSKNVFLLASLIHRREQMSSVYKKNNSWPALLASISKQFLITV